MERSAEHYYTQNTYARFLRNYDRAGYLPYIDLFRRFVKPAEGKVLDIGCGTGTSTLLLRQRGFDAIGADVSEKYLPDNLPGFIRVDFLDAREIPDSSYEAAGCRDVIEHIEDPRRFLAEIIRVVKPGGLILIQAPNLTSPVLAARVVVDNLFGRSTPYLGIDRLSEACWLLLANLWHSLRAKFGTDAFRRRAPKREAGTARYDADAVYWSNPAEIRRALEALGCKICEYQPQARSLAGRIVALHAPDFAGQIFIVVRKK